MKRVLTLAVLFLFFSACGNGDETSDSAGEAVEAELTEFELKHGIGPIDEPLDLGEVQIERARAGAEYFDSRCASCHRMEQRFVGPPLGRVAENRSHEFVLNFMLNPTEMTQRHPVGQALLQEYLTSMPYQNVTEEEAYNILDFLRHYAETGEDLRE